MKFSNYLISGVALARSALCAAALVAATSDVQPASIYPIGKSGGAFAKTAGRVFNLDGKVGYFAGKLSIYHA